MQTEIKYTLEDNKLKVETITTTKTVDVISVSLDEVINKIDNSKNEKQSIIDRHNNNLNYLDIEIKKLDEQYKKCIEYGVKPQDKSKTGGITNLRLIK